MVAAPFNAARLSRGYAEQQRHEAAKSEAASREVLRAAQAFRNPAGQAWQRMSYANASDQLFVRDGADGPAYIIFSPAHCRAVFFNSDLTRRKTFRFWGSLPLETIEEEG